ncbi:hypothetical protein FRACYDRAFT_256568 [Fragilariopsis cylindrus CCMP1102]|uniref:Uncharacterized protein n=1 Tax=Fragilariopsis cylindrus CCMP1102 TaxID=635003 RepID=A0A1E7EJJ4_9STRA|nr:hypothetical protein FRACYDRAFT_256568 [Fragilariopsis cylindrus CCMP1102]|eukprot:OEU06055.1 hypothetical protein FRACYDRAFT_256568 [Fragilariopsis cylindrus CCMP1102]
MIRRAPTRPPPPIRGGGGGGGGTARSGRRRIEFGRGSATVVTPQPPTVRCYSPSSKKKPPEEYLRCNQGIWFQACNIHDDPIHYGEWVNQQNGSGMVESTNGSDPTLAICISLYEEEWEWVNYRTDPIYIPGGMGESTIERTDPIDTIRTGGIDDEFDQIWEKDEEQRRQHAQFETWYWELD